MVHLSNRRMEKNKLRKLYQLFFEVFSNAANKEDFLLIVKDFISPPEQIMLAKRIAIIYLLTKGLISTDIADYLKVSTSTVAKFYLLFHEKETRSIKLIKALITKGKMIGLIDDIFSDLFIQPSLQKGHWKLKIAHERRKYERKTLDP